MVHIRFEGRSIDACRSPTRSRGQHERSGSQRASGAALGCERRDRLSDYVLDRRPSGDLIIRPEAVYG